MKNDRNICNNHLKSDRADRIFAAGPVTTVLIDRSIINH